MVNRPVCSITVQPCSIAGFLRFAYDFSCRFICPNRTVFLLYSTLPSVLSDNFCALVQARACWSKLFIKLSSDIMMKTQIETLIVVLYFWLHLQVKQLLTSMVKLYIQPFTGSVKEFGRQKNQKFKCRQGMHRHSRDILTQIEPTLNLLRCLQVEKNKKQF